VRIVVTRHLRPSATYHVFLIGGKMNKATGPLGAMIPTLPRILVVDDVFGRRLQDAPNRERANLCGVFGLRDATGDAEFPADEEVVNPIADVVFFRGQTPQTAALGDMVENNIQSTMAFVRQGWEPREDRGYSPTWSLVLLDLCFYTGRVTPDSHRNLAGMPEGRAGDDDPRQYFGLQVLERMHIEFPELPVVILSSKHRDEVSESFAAHGALGFIPRTDAASPERLRQYLWRHGLIPDPSGRIIGCSPALLVALRAARRATGDRRNILIRGERGTGKELLAAYINGCEMGRGQPRPLVTVDSGSLSSSLYASELFGHLKGAYTGADRERQGRIVQANGGDLFLDEIGNMPSDVQSGLLRAIESRVVAPLGGGVSREVDVRFISATNDDIELQAVGGGFRPDLLDRLREGGTVVLPPLRERRDDIPILAEQFVRQAEAERFGALKRTITPEAMERLVSCTWPGNIREMRNCIRKAVADHPDVEHLVPQHLTIDSQSAIARITGLHPSSASSHVEAPAQMTEPRTDARPRDIPSLNACFDRIVGDFHEQAAETVEACLAAYRDPRTGKINYTGAYRLAVPSAEGSSNAAADAKRWFRKLFEGKNGLVGPLPPVLIGRYPLLTEARRWACGVDA
jgi:DNA-binding NtrC family response regulator